MIKRSLLWVLAAYCIGIVFRDRLKWILWAVLFLCVFLMGAIWKRKGSVEFAGGYKQLQKKTTQLQWRRNWARVWYGRLQLGMHPSLLKWYGSWAKVCQRQGEKEAHRYKNRFHLVCRRKEVIQQFIQDEKHCMVLLLFALVLGAVLGGLQAADYPIDAVLTERVQATAEGRIQSIAETKSGYRLELNHITIELDVPAENLSEQKRYTKGRLLVYCESAGGLKIGNHIRLDGKAVPFAEPENVGQFDERTYYRAERMCCKFNAEEILVLNAGVNEIREWCRGIRSRLDSIYEEILPKKHAGIVSAVLLGDKVELEADTKALYQKNGIAHILAISGLHVSLLGVGLFAIIRKIGSPLIPAAAATMLILVFYGCLTEFSVSTQRAVGMLVMAMFAKILGRTYDSRSACAFCGLLILIVNPMQLHHAGFQLSFGAAFGISYFGRELELMKLNKGKTAMEKLKVSLLSGITTQLITAPIILNCFYEIPVYSVFLNLPVIGLLSVVVFLCIISGLVGSFSYALGRFLAGGVYMILEFYELLCRMTEKLPCPIWLYGKPQGWRIFAYFAVLGLFFVIAAGLGKRYRHHPRQHCYRRQAFWVLCLLPLVFVRSGKGIEGEQSGSIQGDAGCVIDFLSVGQGDCAAVRTGNGSTYLIDCGSSSVKSVGEYRLKPWLKYHGISKLEAVFLSHPDSDHTNGVLELLENANSPDDWYRGEIQIKNLVLPAAYRKEVEACTAKAERELIEAADKRMEEETGSGEADGKRTQEEAGAGEADGKRTQAVESEEKGFTAIYMLAQKAGIPVIWFDTGDQVTEEGISFICLHPKETYSIQDTNDASMVLVMECPDTVVLFTGDVGENGEEQVLRELYDKTGLQQIVSRSGGMLGIQSESHGENVSRRTVILKVAHHGSKNSTSEELLEVLQPDLAVISCGKNNRFGHPHEETLERLQTAGCEVVSISEGGTVTVLISESKTVMARYK